MMLILEAKASPYVERVSELAYVVSRLLLLINLLVGRAGARRGRR